MTDVVHILPWALLAALLTGLIEFGVLQALRNRSATANIAALVTIPIVAVSVNRFTKTRAEKNPS